MRIATYRRKARPGMPREVGLVSDDGQSLRPLDLAALDAQRGALALIEAHARGEAARSLEQFEHWDGLLHEAIADAAHNSFISKVFRLMNQVRAQGEWGALKRRSATPERRLEYQREHRALVDALQDRDGARATELCLEHLAHVRRNMLGF